MSSISDHLEPCEYMNDFTADWRIKLSVAISLKRIADALEKADVGASVYNAISQALVEDFHRRS